MSTRSGSICSSRNSHGSVRKYRTKAKQSEVDEILFGLRTKKASAFKSMPETVQGRSNTGGHPDVIFRVITYKANAGLNATVGYVKLIKPGFFGRISLKIGDIWLKIGDIWLKIGDIWLKIGEIWLKFDEIWLKLATFG